MRIKLALISIFVAICFNFVNLGSLAETTNLKIPLGRFTVFAQQEAPPPPIFLMVRENANWDYIKDAFPRETNALIMDVETGKTFNVRRTFGTLHADVETLTPEDTEIMRQIWGGWSWERRAVVVYVGDYVFAGSMAGMPHAGLDSAPALSIVNNLSGGFGRGQNLDSVKNNGMDGHVCLHFAGSRIHGSNVINAAHQTRVQEAIAYILDNYR